MYVYLRYIARIHSLIRGKQSHWDSHGFFGGRTASTVSGITSTGSLMAPVMEPWPASCQLVCTGGDPRGQSLYAGWWLGHPSEKYGPSIGMISNPIYGKIKNGNQTTNQYVNFRPFSNTHISQMPKARAKLGRCC